MSRLLVKLCGLRTEADVAAANAALPDFAGFIIEVPGKRRSITLDSAIELAKQLDKRIRPVGVFVDAPVETVNRFLADVPNAAVQLHGSEDAAYIAQLRSKLAAGSDLQAVKHKAAGHVTVCIPSDATLARGRLNPQEARIIQAFRISDGASTLRAAGSSADLVLLDNGAGTGRPFDWRLLTGFPHPFLLAGGLGPNNLPQAIASARAAAGGSFIGVDMSSSLETNGAKDPTKMLAAVQAARN